MAIRRPSYDMSPVSMFLDFELPKMMAQAAREERTYNRRVKEKKDAVAATGVEEVLKTLTVDSGAEEFAKAENTIQGFRELYAEDPLMSEYLPIFDNMYANKRNRADRNIAIGNELDKSLENIEGRIKGLDVTGGDQRESVATLLDNAKKTYTEGLNYLSKGEASYYDNMFKDLGSDNAVASTLQSYMLANNTNPDDPYQAEAIKDNDIKYQTLWDSAYDSFLAGDNVSARSFMNEAKGIKAKSGQLYSEITAGLDMYFDKNENGSYLDTVKDEFIGQIIPIQNPYTLDSTPTNIDRYLTEAKVAFERGDLEGTQTMLRNLPKTLSQYEATKAKFEVKIKEDEGKIISSHLIDATDNLDNIYYADPKDKKSDKLIDDEVYTILDDMKTNLKTLGLGKGKIIPITREVTKEIETAISDLAVHAESSSLEALSDILTFGDFTEATLQSKIDTYLAAVDDKKKATAAAELSQYVMDNSSLINKMDFKTGGGEGSKAREKLKDLIKSYEAIHVANKRRLTSSR